ncbi:biopolymer transporter ExbD [Mucilaginibacter rubeus]|uniref:Biopolymer transporter ExbD n=1 Tax=Mucilaginibacter rubeus TaxID=2027860 RepID=A0AAE6JH79_9SPHI|nr:MULTISPECIES: biopolymer transporter ExbD [Mucilaginibacter]QEM05393.1 biopolymer transporter ExbD [Mucilaginibacter rubeus]QEM17981.1 biopolymer transporter ExbD [Mucilaginibacter gossypii]QTE45485.1 biopolymer transporter ExbD [Mucilaginibacter rubeus]QTE52082.1 biopolymer transporter ExbD [Mucilaginibacter rubeus]QTE57170.1 biopolymer transporter ExbD [Mucilaginibacter rubeus]
MAELNSSPQNGGGKHKRKKINARVDLTAMVDLAFLLITFFIMTTTLAKPKAMDLAMPDDGGEVMPVPASRTLSVVLGKNNKVVYFLGELKNPVISPSVTDFSANGIRKAIIETNKKVHDNTGKSMIVLVKPSDKSQYSNLVSTLDELAITGIQQYAIVDIMPADVDALKQKGI